MDVVAGVCRGRASILRVDVVAPGTQRIFEEGG